MIKSFKNTLRLSQTKFSFGATSAIITNLALIIGLARLANPKWAIAGGVLIIALADNIADSVGIHLYQESECLSEKEVWFSTITNFITRIFVSLTFLGFVLFLPIKLAVACSIVWGLLLLSFLSYTIAKARELNPYVAIIEHISIALIVILASNYVSIWISSRF